MDTRSPRCTRSSGPGIDPLKPSIEVALSPAGRICSVTASAFSRSGVAAANVGIGKIAVAETVAKKYRLFMW
ncbi:hypothetical protein N9854_05445 [Amylibacter sp.]|nr:hypothetical protein [Amylibacter sp.]